MDSRDRTAPLLQQAPSAAGSQSFDLRGVRRAPASRARVWFRVGFLLAVPLALISEWLLLDGGAVYPFLAHPTLAGALAPTLWPLVFLFLPLLGFFVVMSRGFLWTVPEGMVLTDDGAVFYLHERVVSRLSLDPMRGRKLVVYDFASDGTSRTRAKLILNTGMMGPHPVDISSASLHALIARAKSRGWRVTYPGSTEGQPWSGGQVYFYPR